MPLFIWKDHYETGDEEIDSHHRHLVHLLNQAHDRFVDHAPAAELDALFHELIDYATYHFAAEERIMRERRYPEESRHRDEHERFGRRVVEMHTRYERGEKVLFLEILGFLHNWLTHHILKVDMELGRFLNAGPDPARHREREHGNI